MSEFKREAQEYDSAIHSLTLMTREDEGVSKIGGELHHLAKRRANWSHSYSHI